MVRLNNYPLFQEFPEITAWTSTRKGGMSQMPYESLNLSFELGDDPLCVRHNRKLVKDQLPPSTWIELKQTHGTEILWIEEIPEPDELWGIHLAGAADAMITRLEKVCLVIKHADCQATLIYDPVTKTLAAVHAGWRGLIGGIYKKTIDKLIESGSNPADLRVAVSPSLGPCCSQFIHWEEELGLESANYKVSGSCDRFRLIDIGLDHFISMGVLRKHITITDYCTKCIPDYFSHRRGIDRGRMVSGIQIN